MIGVISINKLMNKLWYLRKKWSLGFHTDFTAVPPGIISGLAMQNDKPSSLSAVKVNMTNCINIQGKELLCNSPVLGGRGGSSLKVYHLK